MHTTLSPQTSAVCGTTASRTEPKSQLSDEQWDLIADMFAEYVPTRAGGRPPCPPRACLEGILWILRTGARWKDLPKCFPSPATCWRRLQEWSESGLFAAMWVRLLLHLDDLKRIDWSQAIADGTFSRAKKGAPASEKPSAARGLRSWSWPMVTGSPSQRKSIAPAPPK
jgi:transposase